MPVVDASVVVEYLIGAEHADRARERLQSFNGSLWAPHLLDAEVGHTVRRFAAQGAISASRARTALGHLAELPIIRVGHLGLLESAWALRARLSFYHALYVALAQRLGTSLLTCDGRLAEAPGLTAPVQRL